MATTAKMALSEIQLLQREIEAHGEWLSREQLDRKTETDRLRMEIETLKRILTRLHPEFISLYRMELDKVRIDFNPEG